MTTVALDKAYDSIGAITGLFNFHGGKKTVSVIKEVICITSDKESVKETKQLVEFLTKIKDSLPVKKTEITVIQVQKNLDIINANLTQVNSFFQTLKDLFDSGDDITIDDKNMLEVIQNLQHAQGIMEYISDYLTLLMSVVKYHPQPVKEYSLDSLLEFMHAA